MKLSHQVPLVAVAILLVCALALAQETTLSDTTTPQTATGNPTYPGGLINRLISPFRQRFSSARTFLSSQLGNVRNITEQQIFSIFMRLYNKTYSVEELPRRMAIFFQRRKMIDNSVQSFLEGKLPYSMKENRFTDWDENELKKLTGVSIPPLDELDSSELEEPASNSSDYNEVNFSVQAEKIPASKDWSTSGCVSTPINQINCGACYAIATMSVVETMKCLTSSTSPMLSPQQIVDCASSRQGYANFGCDGGWPTRVLKYLQDKNVVTRETCYPFVRRQQFCKLDAVSRTTGCSMKAGISGNKVNFKVLHNENDILYHVAKTGPVVTVMKASDRFLFYGGNGIFDDPSCSNRRDDVDHAIVITGYGKENNVDYWLIKNSWGVDEWGDKGYAKYRRGKNACSIGHWGWVVT